MRVIIPSDADLLGGAEGYTGKQFEAITIQLVYEPSVRARWEWLVRQLEGKTQTLTQATFFPPKTLRQGLLGRPRVKADSLTRLDARVTAASTAPYVGVTSWLSDLYAPQLRWLAATNSPDVWKLVSRCKLLETLEVEIAHHEDDARRLSWNTISTALHGHTNLHSLSIHCQAGRGSLSPMVLQSLRYLTLKGDPGACKQFLAHVSLPTLKMIRLGTAYRSNSDQDVRTLLEAISNFTPDALYANDRSFRWFGYPGGQRAADVHIEPHIGVHLRLRSLDSFPEGWVSGIRYIEIVSWQSGMTLLPPSSLPSSLPSDASISSDSPTHCNGCDLLMLPSGFAAYFKYFKRLERLTIENKSHHRVLVSRHSSAYTITHVEHEVLKCFAQQTAPETGRFTFIDNLPVELLGMIYKCRFVDGGFKAVMTMMSVCKYWRKAAGTVPCLWLPRHPDPELPTVVSRLPPVDTWPITMPLFRANMNEITSLDISLSDRDAENLKDYDKDHIVTPNLQRLDTTFPNPQIGRSRGSAITISVIKAHHLRSLTTYSSPALWQTLLPEIATLEELSVLYERDDAPGVYMDQIFEALLALPALHSFSLSCRCIFGAPNGSPELDISDRHKWGSRYDDTILPRLQNLTLAGCHIPYLMQVYKILTSRPGPHPPKVMFRLHDSHTNPSFPDLMDTEYVEELSTILQNNSIQANHLVVHPCPPFTPGSPARRYGQGSSLIGPLLRLQGYNVSESPRRSDLIFDLSRNVYELDTMRRHTIIDYVNNLIVGLRLANIQSLDIHGGFSPPWFEERSDYPVTELRKVLVDALVAAMPGVEQLKFEQCHIEDIKRVFLPPGHKSRPKRLERLERLTIKRMRQNFPDRGNPIVGILQNFACLKRFDFEDDWQGGVGPMIPKIIREFVDEVYVDGVEVEVEERRHLLDCYGYGKTSKPQCDCSAHWEVV